MPLKSDQSPVYWKFCQGVYPAYSLLLIRMYPVASEWKFAALVNVRLLFSLRPMVNLTGFASVPQIRKSPDWIVPTEL